LRAGWSSERTDSERRCTGAPIAVRSASAVTYLHADHLGSVSVTTGASTASQTFTPWGAIPMSDERRTTTDERRMLNAPRPPTPDP
jgi:hypothetical protein